VKLVGYPDDLCDVFSPGSFAGWPPEIERRSARASCAGRMFRERVSERRVAADLD
jgi:hypothetical protein